MRKQNRFFKRNMTAAVVLAIVMGLGVVIFHHPVHAQVVQKAVIATTAADYSSGAHAVADVDPVGGPRAVSTELLPTISDITVEAYGRYFYRIERFTADNVAKFDIDDPERVIWQYSTMDGNDTVDSSNPYALIFVNAQKAYLLRYGAPTAWIVNPSTTSESGFKIGELDLSAYADADGVPEMVAGVIVDGKLFILLQRQVNWTIVSGVSSYLAVFDTETDTEITTGIPNSDGLKGVPLPISNPGTIQYLAENDTLYIQGAGKYASSWSGTPAEYSGGIITMDPDTYAATLIIDDDTNGDGVPLYGGNISGMAVVSAAKGYFVAYESWGNNTVYRFNPSTGAVGTPVSGLQNKNIAGMQSGVYLDKNHMLWVCNASDARVEILNTATDTVDESLGTELNPQKVVFATYEDVSGDANNNGIPDDQEVAAGVDLDNDGVDDNVQDDIKSVNTVVGDAQIGVAAGTNVTSILSMQSIDPETIADTTGKPEELPFGLIQFSLAVPNGATAEVTVYMSEPAPEGHGWYKYDPIGGWQDFSAHATFSPDRTSVTLALQDGGFGDADGEVNGIIMDPSGPGGDGTPTDGDDDGDDDGGGGGGCFIAATVSSNAPGGHTVVVGLTALACLVVFGCLLIRRQKNA